MLRHMLLWKKFDYNKAIKTAYSIVTEECEVRCDKIWTQDIVSTFAP